MLTQKQKELLLFIHERMSTGDIAPSFEEMKEALDLKSKSGIHRLISALVERGYLERLPHRARALQVRRLPEGYRPSGQDGSDAAMQARNVNATYADAGHYASAANESIPLYGKIAAGTPIEAIRNEVNTIDVPPTLIGKGDHYALEVEGDSMIKAGIHDGDTVIIRRSEAAHNGDIVVALVDGEEVTLKRYRRAGNKVILEPENDDYEPRVLDPERVQVQGHLVSLMRTYH
jgi:repressor LexA